MIPDEAVEAAYDISTHLNITTSDIERILEAAAPHLMASVEQDAYNRGWGAGFRHTHAAMKGLAE